MTPPLDDDLDVTRRGFPSPVLIAGAAVGLVGFVVAIEKASWSSVDGRIVDATYRNWGALGAGIAAIGLAALALATWRSIRMRSRIAHVVAAFAVIGLGGVQVARGLGAFWEPPGSRDRAHDATENMRFSDERLAIEDVSPDKPVAPVVAAERSLDELDEQCRRDTAACPAYRAALERACTADDYQKCARLAVTHLHDVGGPGDLVAGRAAAVKSCDAGNGLGCSNLAYYAAIGAGGPVDPDLAIRSARTGCEAGSYLGCKNLAGMIDDEIVKPPRNERRALLDLACQHYNDRGCEMLADDLIADEDNLSDQGKAAMRGSLMRLCQMGNPAACRIFGVTAARGIGGAEDAKLGELARRRACAIGDSKACDADAEVGKRRGVHFISVTAADGGDHLDRIETLERAFAPCAAALTTGTDIDGEWVTDASGNLISFRLEGPAAPRECMFERLPYALEVEVPGTSIAVKFRITLTPP